jgi:hypothetical protein
MAPHGAKRGLRVLVTLLVSLTPGPSCKRFVKPDVARMCGDWVSDNDAVRGVCVDKTTFVSCGDEHAVVPCRGPKGCSADGVGMLHESCDVSGDQSGDRCVYSNSHHDQCAADGKNVIACEMGMGEPDRYAVIPCLGPKGCVHEGMGEPLCDDSVGVVGEVCTPMSASCSRDHEMLGCDSALGGPGPGHWKLEDNCRGPAGCERKPNSDGHGFSISCDDDVAVIGDACLFEGKSACNVEGTARLECKDHHMVQGQNCKCTIDRPDKHTSSLTCSGR